MSEPKKPRERRLHPRYQLQGPIALGTGREGTGVLRDISMSGLSCLSPISFEEMTVLEITMTLPGPAGGGTAFKVGGAVVRCDPAPEGGHMVAVFFTHMDEANGKVLEDFIARQAAG